VQKPSSCSAQSLEQLGESLRSTGVLRSSTVDGIKLRYWQQGHKSKTIVFLHGNSCLKEVFYEQFSYFANHGYTLLAIDLPGHGGSGNATDPDVQYTIPGYARTIDKLLTDLNISEYVLVGWSLGGNIALEMAAQGCGIRAMLLMGAPPVGPGADNFEFAYLPGTLDTGMQDADPGDDEITLFAKSIYSTLNPVPELFLDAARRTDGSAREIMMNHWLAGTDGYDQLLTASEWTNPICIVHGEDEPFVSLPYIENARWKKLWRNEVQIIPNSAHAPFVENPFNFNKILEEFLADIDG